VALLKTDPRKNKKKRVKVIFVKHGSVGFVNIYNDCSDPHLTPTGLRQVMAIIEEIRKHKPTSIVASSMNRTAETATTLAAGLNIPWTKKESIASLDTSGVNVAKLLATIEASGMTWQWFWYEKGWPGLESCRDYVSKTAKAILEMLKAADGPVVLVGHSETYLALVSLMDIPIISALSTDVPNACAWVFDIGVEEDKE
jgi:broad specificity phosphatase PhoE